MKIIALNASTLPIYCRELSTVLLDAQASGNLSGFPSSLSQEAAESTFYRLRDAISKHKR